MPVTQSIGRVTSLTLSDWSDWSDCTAECGGGLTGLTFGYRMKWCFQWGENLVLGNELTSGLSKNISFGEKVGGVTSYVGSGLGIALG